MYLIEVGVGLCLPAVLLVQSTSCSCTASLVFRPQADCRRGIACLAEVERPLESKRLDFEVDRIIAEPLLGGTSTLPA